MASTLDAPRAAGPPWSRTSDVVGSLGTPPVITATLPGHAPAAVPVGLSAETGSRSSSKDVAALTISQMAARLGGSAVPLHEERPAGRHEAAPRTCVLEPAPMHTDVRMHDQVSEPGSAAAAQMADVSPGPDEEGGFHTPKSWATVSGARLRLLEGGDGRGSQSHGQELPNYCGSKRPEAGHAPAAAASATSYVSSSCMSSATSPMLHSSSAAQASTRHPAVAHATNGIDSGLLSAKGWHNRLKLEYQELAREVLSEQVAEADAQARLDCELSELKDRSMEEANSINDLFHEIGDAGRLLREELHDMDEAKSSLQAELAGEEIHRQVWEAELRKDEEEMCVRVQAQQRQLTEMNVSRRCMEAHLQRMASTQAWLRGDIDDARRTRGAVEVVGQRELEERAEEMQRTSNELHVGIQELRSDHDTWRAQAESEVFRLRQESKRQVLEESELSEQIANANEHHSEVRSKLRENVESCSKEGTDLSQRISLLREECKHQDEVEQPLYLAENRSLVVELEGEEEVRNTLLVELESLTAVCSQARVHAEGFCNWEMAEASAARLTAADRQAGSRLKSELQALNNDILEAQRREAALHEDMENAQRGFLGFCKRRAPRRDSDLEAGKRPPLPPPLAPPVPDPDKGPYAFREGP